MNLGFRDAPDGQARLHDISHWIRQFEQRVEEAKVVIRRIEDALQFDDLDEEQRETHEMNLRCTQRQLEYFENELEIWQEAFVRVTEEIQEAMLNADERGLGRSS